MKRPLSARLGLLVGNLIVIALFLFAVVVSVTAFTNLLTLTAVPSVALMFSRWFVGMGIAGGVIAFLLVGWLLIGRLGKPPGRG